MSRRRSCSSVSWTSDGLHDESLIWWAWHNAMHIAARLRSKAERIATQWRLSFITQLSLISKVIWWFGSLANYFNSLPTLAILAIGEMTRLQHGSDASRSTHNGLNRGPANEARGLQPSASTEDCPAFSYIFHPQFRYGFLCLLRFSNAA